MSGKAPVSLYNNTEDYKSKTAIATATTQSGKTADGAAVNIIVATIETAIMLLRLLKWYFLEYNL